MVFILPTLKQWLLYKGQIKPSTLQAFQNYSMSRTQLLKNSQVQKKKAEEHNLKSSSSEMRLPIFQVSPPHVLCNLSAPRVSFSKPKIMQWAHSYSGPWSLNSLSLVSSFPHFQMGCSLTCIQAWAQMSLPQWCLPYLPNLTPPAPEWCSKPLL